MTLRFRKKMDTFRAFILHSIDDIVEFQNGFLHYKAMKYGIIERLLEWKFDIFGLLKDNLAIPVTKDFNPYK
jgi:hypothetical protein